MLLKNFYYQKCVHIADFSINYVNVDSEKHFWKLVF